MRRIPLWVGLLVVILAATMSGRATIPPPTNVHVTATTQTSVTLAWDGTSKAFTVWLNGVKVTKITVKSYTVTGLVCGTQYQLGVRSVQGQDQSTIVTVQTSTADCSGPPPPSQRYASSSPFNQALPDPTVTPLDANSAAIVNYINTQYGTTGAFSPVTISNTPASDTASNWDHPVYYATSSDPLYTVNETEYVGNNQGAQIRIPAGAMHALGSDGHLAVVQPDGTEQDFWQVQNANPITGGGTLTAHAGGNGGSITTGSGVCDTQSACGFSTAALQDLAAGQIRGEELSAGAINHALVVVLKCDSGTHVYPAFGNGNHCAVTANAPAEGQRFQLRMTDAQVDALSIPDYRKMILKALIHYGFYVVDTGGSPWDMQFEPGMEYGAVNPLITYAQQAGLTQGTTYTLDLNSGVNWGLLQVVAVCYTQGAC